MRKERFCFLISLTAAFSICACVNPAMRIGETQTESRSVALGGAKSARVKLEIGAGDLKITGGAAHLLDATFSYNVPAWKPKVEYNVSGNEGWLTISQPGNGHGSMGEAHSSWDLSLGDGVPMDLSVEMGAGNADLSLSSLSLTDLTVEMGAGDATVDLAGDWKRDLSARISGGVGNAIVRLPRGVGVRVTVEGGIGTVSAPDFKKDGDAYVNDAYGKSAVTLRVSIEGGVGTVHLELGGARPIV